MTENEKNEFVPIPLPSQIPEPPDLSKVPLSVLHSATVEALLSQTEDLMARLKVQIRRNAVLERRALDFEDKSQQLEKQMQTLQQQNEVLIEKEQFQSEKLKETQTQLEASQKEMSLLEIRYSENFALSQKNEADSQKTITDLKSEVNQLKALLPLEQENIKIKDENQFFKGKIEELCNYIQKKEDELISAKNLMAQKELVIEQHEESIKKLNQQVNFNLKAVEEKAELENLIILKDREKEHSLQSLQHEVQKNRQELQNIHFAYQNLQNEKLHIESQLRTLEEASTGFQKDNSELEKQIENLQNLWYKLQAEFEKEKTKNTALNKLNRELALQLHHKISATGTEDEYFKKFILQNRDIEV